MTKYAIHFHDISYERNGEIIFQHLSGAFKEGTITALVGPSGSRY